MAIDVGKLVCDYGRVDDSPASGTVWVQPLNFATDGSTVLVPVKLPFEIAEDGTLDADVVIDNEDITPDLYLQIEERIRGAANRAAFIIKPTEPETNLATAARYAIGPVESIPVANSPVALVDAPTIATDASKGNVFRVTLGGNRTLGVPTNPSDAQKVVWEIIQDGVGGRELALSSAFKFGDDLSSITLSTSPGAIDYIGALFSSVSAKWSVLAFSRGY
jgi:hypothetical protein